MLLLFLLQKKLYLSHLLFLSFKFSAFMSFLLRRLSGINALFALIAPAQDPPTCRNRTSPQTLCTALQPAARVKERMQAIQAQLHGLWQICLFSAKLHWKLFIVSFDELAHFCLSFCSERNQNRESKFESYFARLSIGRPRYSQMMCSKESLQIPNLYIKRPIL